MSRANGYQGRWVGLIVVAGLAFGTQARAQNCENCAKECCPPPFKYHPEGPPRIKYKYGCHKPICDFCNLPHYGYFQTCWHPWPFPPDWSHCPVPPPGDLVPHLPAGPRPRFQPEERAPGAPPPEPSPSSSQRPMDMQPMAVTPLPVETSAPRLNPVRVREINVCAAPTVKPAPEWLPPPSEHVRPEQPTSAAPAPITERQEIIIPTRSEPASIPVEAPRVRPEPTPVRQEPMPVRQETRPEPMPVRQEPTTLPVRQEPMPARQDTLPVPPPLNMAQQSLPVMQPTMPAPQQTMPAESRMPVGPAEPRPLPIQMEERRVMPKAEDPMPAAPAAAPEVVTPLPAQPMPSRAVEAPAQQPVQPTSAGISNDQPMQYRKSIGSVNVRMVNSKRIMLDYDTKDLGMSAGSLLELWYTQDGRSWFKDPTQVKSGAPYMVEVNKEGTYGFTLLARRPGDNGRGPASGEQPQVWVEVDWTKPAVHLVDVKAGAFGHPRNVAISWIASDANLTRQPITLSWSEKVDGPWKAIATNLENAGRYTWLAPNNVPSHVYIRVEAFDAVGNIGAAETTTPVVIPSAE